MFCWVWRRVAGEVARASGQPAQAAEALRKALDAQPRGIEALKALAQLGKETEDNDVIIEANLQLVGWGVWCWACFLQGGQNGQFSIW